MLQILLIALFLSSCIVCPLTYAADPVPSPDDKPPILSELVILHASQLGGIVSDQEAIAYFTAHLGPALRLHDAVVELQTPARSGKVGADPLKNLRTDLVESAVRLVAALVTWHWIDGALRMTQTSEKDSVRTWLEQSEAARKWLAPPSNQGGTLVPLARFGEVLASVREHYPSTASAASTPPCTDYNAHLDTSYPALVDQPRSWLDVAEQDGLKGLKTRLEDQSLASGLSLANQRICARLYLETRLLPVFRAHLITLLLMARGEADRKAQAFLDQLQRWPERKRDVLGLTRLCGTWQWSIHNHRHHQETKTTMVFPPVDGPTPPGLRPSKIVVMGDAVYLRWDFQGGFQEESLLFGGEGARLEGTFINSTGAWGSITGKRTTACPR